LSKVFRIQSNLIFPTLDKLSVYQEPPPQYRKQESKEQPDLTPRQLRPSNIAIKPSPYQNLHDPPTPTGKLADRIRRLRDRCIDALGRSAFEKAHKFLVEYVRPSIYTY
jgi:hypothetical protein